MRYFKEIPDRTPDSNHPSMFKEGFDASNASMDYKGGSIHFPHSLGTRLCDDKNDNVIFSRKEASRKVRKDSASFNHVPRNESFFHKVGPNFFIDRLNYCTEELGAESISCISEGIVTRPNTSLGTFGQDIVLTRDKSIRRVVNVTHVCARALPVEADGDPCDIKNAENLLQEKNDVHRDLRGETSRIYDRFPPPISSLACNTGHMILQSYRTNGRLVLRKIEYPCPKIFRVNRRDGRLRLELLSPFAEDSEHSSATSTSLDEKARLTTKVEQPISRKEMDKGSYFSSAEEILESLADKETVGKGKDFQSQSYIKLLIKVQPEMEVSVQLREETLAEQETHAGAATNAEDILRADLVGIPETDTNSDDRKALAREATKASCLNLFYAGFIDALLCLLATQYSVQRFYFGERNLPRTGTGEMLNPRGDFELLFAKLGGWEPAEKARMMNELAGPKRKECAHRLQDVVMAEKSWARLQNLSFLVCCNKGKVNFNLCAMYTWKDLSLSSLDEKLGASVQRTDGAEPL